jgi:hypothetical protein
MDWLALIQIRRDAMKVKFALAGVAGLLIVFAPLAAAKDHAAYDNAVLLGMQSAKCGVSEKGGKSVTGELLGTESGKKQSADVLCQEYVLQADRVIYHIRPTDQKHPVLLPVGDSIRFRIHKDKFLVLDSERDKKERVYTVVSMEPRTEAEVAKNTPESR